jgi:hypothetical protein
MRPEETRKLEIGHQIFGRAGVKGVVTSVTGHHFIIQWEDGNEDLYGFASHRRMSVAEEFRNLQTVRCNPPVGAAGGRAKNIEA